MKDPGGTLKQVAWDWSLGPDSRALIVGAYSGNTIRNLWSRYKPHIVALEPQLGRALALSEEFAAEPKIVVVPVGIGEESRAAQLDNVGMDRASFLADRGVPGARRDALMLEARFLLDLYGLDHIDFLHLNCEGYEYVLLPHFAQTGLAERIDRFMVQIHPRGQLALTLGQIDAVLSRTHDRYWFRAPSWVTWVQRGVEP